MDNRTDGERFRVIEYAPRRIRRAFRDWQDPLLWALCAGLIVTCIVLAGTLRP